eukprot:jgi/Botrbrau1/1786/Bobra.0217s0041.1
MSVEFTNRDLGTRPTWDLSRLDAMAAEARALCDTIWSVDGGPGPSKGTTQAGPVGGPPASAPTPLVPRTQTDGVPRRRPQLRSRMVSANWAPSWGGTAGRDSAGASAGGNASRDRNSSSTGNAGAVPVNPVQALVAVNSVLFDRHGYRRMDRHGDPRDAMLPQVLERGRERPRHWPFCTWRSARGWECRWQRSCWRRGATWCSGPSTNRWWWPAADL